MRALVTGATGFVGRALVPALVGVGDEVRAGTRRLPASSNEAFRWVHCDIASRSSLASALAGVDCAYYLVHGMGSGNPDYSKAESDAAHAFADEAARAGCRRVVYLGGVAPAVAPSKHLASRLRVGEILRAGAVPALELRAAMIVGEGGASWQIVRDLAARLPVMILPRWLESKSCPVALDDVVRALVDARTVPLAESAWFDLPGPEVLSGREILLRVAALRGRRLRTLRVPVLTPALSAMWLRLVTRTDYQIARELVMGLTGDLVPRDARYWEITAHGPLCTFDEAAREAIVRERRTPGALGAAAALEERIVERISPRL